MGTGKALAIKLSGIVNLEDDLALLSSLAELGRKWRDRAGDVDGYSSAVTLIRAVADGVTTSSVTQAFTKLGAENEQTELAKAADRLKQLLDGVPDTVAKLLEPIGTYDEQRSAGRDTGVVSWPILDKQAGGAGGGAAGSDPGYALSLKADAALTFEAGDSWPYSDPMPGPLLRLRAEGGLEPAGTATLPFSAGSADVSATGSAHCSLEYYFAPSDQHSLYALVLARRLGTLPDPFDFDSVWDAFAGTDLAGIHYEFGGAAKVEVAVSVADSLAFGSLAAAELGLKINVGVELGGKFFLTFRAGPRGADGQPRIVAALSRERERGGTLGARLGLTVDLAGLAARVHDILAGVIGEWDSVLGEVKPFLSPGTLIRSKAAALIEKQARDLLENEDVRAAIVRDLDGLAGIGDTDDPALVTWLTGQLGAALDLASGWARERASAAIAVTDVLGTRLPAFAQDTIRPKLEAAAATLISKAQDELETQVKSLFAARARDLGKALHKAGAAVDGKVETADDALEGVRSLIERYNRIFHKVFDATQDAARTKVSAAVQVEESRQDSATLEISGTLLARSDGARAVFRSLTRGNFGTLLKLVEDGGSSDFALDASRSSLSRFSTRKSRFGLDLVLLGFGITGAELLSGEASVLVDGTGKVQVDSRAMLQKRFSGLDADREIELVSSFSLVSARLLQANGAPPAAERGLGLSVSMGHVDEGLKRAEVERFVSSLSDSGLVSASALARAQATFTRWAGTPGSNGKIAGALLLKLALDQTSLSSLLCLSAFPTPGPLRDDWRKWVIRIAFDALRQASSPQERTDMDGTIAVLAQQRPGRTLEDLLGDPEKTKRKLMTIVTGSHIPRVPEEHEAFTDAADLGNGLYAMIETLRQIYFSTPELQPDDQSYTWGPRDYASAERRAAAAVRGWLQLNAVLFWTNSKVHPRMIAFIKCLSTLGRIDRSKALSLVMWRTDSSPEAIVLSPADG